MLGRRFFTDSLHFSSLFLSWIYAVFSRRSPTILLEMKWHTNPNGTLTARWCEPTEKSQTPSEDGSMAPEYQSDARHTPSSSANSSMLEVASMLVDKANAASSQDN